MNTNINNNNNGFKNQQLRIADILAADDDEGGEYFVRDLGMECWLPRGVVARWLAAVWRRRRKNKERPVVNVVQPRKTEGEENQRLRTRGSVDGLEGRPGSSFSPSESEAFYLLCFLIIEFVVVSLNVS